MKNACEGVLYPQNAASSIRLESAVQKPYSIPLKCKDCQLEGILVPHSSWQYCKDELESVFTYLSHKDNITDCKNVFVLAPIHKGPIVPDENNKIYSTQDGVLKGSDWKICLETPQKIKAHVQQNDDVCTEEHCLEIIAPFIYKLMPRARVCYLLATGQTEEICKITSIIGRFYSNSIIFLSSNKETNCAYMWRSLEG